MSVISLAVGALVVVIITGRFRKRFRKLNSELVDLSKDVDELTIELLSRPGYEVLKSHTAKDGEESETDDAAATKDPVEQIDMQIKQMRGEVGEFVSYMRDQLTSALSSAMRGQRISRDRTRSAIRLFIPAFLITTATSPATPSASTASTPPPTSTS